MINKKVEELCNRQVEREGFSSNLYLSMASWAENNGMPGIAGWLYAQAEEERMHMLKFFKYINERGGKAVMPAIKKPSADFKSVEQVFDEVLKHEEFITSSINEIVALTLEEKDFNTHNFLQWFVTEQVGHSYASTTAIYTSVSDDFKTKTLQAALRRVYGSSTTTGEGGDEH